MNPKHPPFLCREKLLNQRFVTRRLLTDETKKKQRHPKTTKEGTLDLLPPPRIPVITKDDYISWYVGTFICHPYWLGGGYIQAVIVSKKNPPKTHRRPAQELHLLIRNLRLKLLGTLLPQHHGLLLLHLGRHTQVPKGGSLSFTRKASHQGWGIGQPPVTIRKKGQKMLPV